jgi:hypothetical protein
MSLKTSIQKCKKCERGDDGEINEEEFDYSYVENGDENSKLDSYFYCYEVKCPPNNSDQKYWEELASQFLHRWKSILSHRLGGTPPSSRYLAEDI